MRAPRRTGPGEASQGEDLVPHQVQADDVWTVTLIEVRAHSVPYGEAQFLHGLRLRMDCMAERVGDIPTLRSLLNEEDNLNVVSGACHRTGSYHDWPPLSMIDSPDGFCAAPRRTICLSTAHAIHIVQLVKSAFAANIGDGYLPPSLLAFRTSPLPIEPESRVNSS